MLKFFIVLLVFASIFVLATIRWLIKSILVASPWIALNNRLINLDIK